jgi:glycosyltransferase involved in cell wall biosynthesis
MRQLLTGLETTGVELDVLFFNRLAQGMRVYLDATNRLQERIQHHHYDVVHVTYGGVLAERVTSVVRERPTIVTFCGSDLLGENLSGRVRKLVSRCGVLASHRAARLASGIVVQSANLERALPGNVDRTKLQIIPNGVDLNRFKPQDRDSSCRQLGWNPEQFHILFSRNGGDSVKRLDLAQAAVDQLKRHAIVANLHLLQGVPHDDVPTWLNACDVLLLTSQHEGSPNIVKEALACDRPVISVDVGDVAEMIRGIEGCYLATRDPRNLAVGLRCAYEGPRRVDGRARMVQFSLSVASKRLVQFYSEARDRFK